MESAMSAFGGLGGLGSSFLSLGGVLVSPTYAITPVKLTGQTSDYTSRTLFTPTGPGLYRFNWYACATASDPGAGTLSANLTWTDDAAFQGNIFTTTLPLTSSGTSAYVNAVWVFEAIAQPVSFGFTGGGTYGAAVYSLYYNVELIS
jgi:hypothetical protein